MNLWDRATREIRYLVRAVRTLNAVAKIDPDSNFLICDDFEHAVDRFADTVAIIFENQSVTYRELDALANRFAAWAEAQGLSHTDTVALMLPNRIEYIAAWVGLAKRGVVAALINTNLTGAALAHCLTISSAKHVITDATLLDVFNPTDPAIVLWSIDAISDTARCRALDLHQPTTPPPRPDRSVRAALKAHDTALYIFTSGTTGMPKAAKITHVRAQLYMRAFAGVTNSDPNDRIYCALPLYHSTGGLCGVGAALLHGATLVLRRKFSATHFWDDMVAYGCTMFVYIGELCRYLVNQPPSPNERAHQLRLAFGNGMRPDVWTEFTERFGVKNIIEFYGSTEGNVSLFNFDGQPGAIGRVPAYLKQRFMVRLVKFDVESEQPVRDANGLCIECKPDEIGEAIGLIKNDARSEFAGYADKAASAKKILNNVFTQGDAWFRTGDLMRQDKDGYFYFVDRIGDTFRWKGENVSTTEVSGALSRAPGVSEVIVYGAKIDKLDGRAGMAAITPGDGFDLAALHAFAAKELPAYARPIFVRLKPAMETTGTFKYTKMDLEKDGFDPARVGDVYVDDVSANAYVKITPDLYAKIQNGDMRL